MKPVLWQKVPKLHIHIYPLLLTGGRNLVYFHYSESCFRAMGRFSNFSYLAMNLEIEKKLQKWIHVTPLSTQGFKLSLLSLYGQWLLRYGPIFIITQFGTKPAILKSSRGCIWTFFLPKGDETGLIFALRAAVFGICADFQTAIFGHETFEVSKVHMDPYTIIYYPYFRSSGSGFQDTGRFLKIYIFGHETWNLKKEFRKFYMGLLTSRGDG